MPTLGDVLSRHPITSAATLTAAGLRLHLPPDPVAVAQARRFVQQHSRAHGIDTRARATAVLLTSELVINAVVHPGSGVCVTLHLTPTHLVVEVADANPRPPHVRQQRRDRLNGCGLPTVSHLADDCGTYSRAAGKVVWFSLSTPRDRADKVPSCGGMPFAGIARHG